MGYKAKFRNWGALTVENLLVTYRKAKADCFFENTFPTAIKFAEYEQDLLANLNDLLGRLKSNSGFKDDEELLGCLGISDYYQRSYPPIESQIPVKMVMCISANQSEQSKVCSRTTI